MCPIIPYPSSTFYCFGRLTHFAHVRHIPGAKDGADVVLWEGSPYCKELMTKIESFMLGFGPIESVRALISSVIIFVNFEKVESAEAAMRCLTGGLREGYRTSMFSNDVTIGFGRGKKTTRKVVTVAPDI